MIPVAHWYLREPLRRQNDEAKIYNMEMLVLGLFIVIFVRDFKMGIFVTLSGTLLAMVFYFWVSFVILQFWGTFNSVIASNLSLSTGIINTIFLYIFCLFGNMIAMIFLGFIS